MSILITKHRLDLLNLYDMRDDIGLSRKECEPTSTCGDLRKAKAYRDRRVMRLVSDHIPMINLTVYVWVPANDHDKAVILDGRKRLMDILSCVDDTYSLSEGACSLDLKAQLHATKNLLSETLLLVNVDAVVITSASYWEAAIATYPEICGHAHKTVLKEQEMLMRYLDMEDDIFTDEDYCDWRVSNLKMGIEKFKRKPPLSPHEYLKSEGWQKVKAMKSELRATEFVARHHHRGVIPC